MGEGIRRFGLDRSAVFIETKIWISDYGYDATLHAFDKSAGKLGIDRRDLLILYQPLPTRFDFALTDTSLPRSMGSPVACGAAPSRPRSRSSPSGERSRRLDDHIRLTRRSHDATASRAWSTSSPCTARPSPTTVAPGHACA